MIYPSIRNLLFQFDPELAHAIALKGLKYLNKLRLLKKQVFIAPRTVMGIEFKNPVGLAAGLDKNGEYIDALAALGFGFVEIGTVTPKPQSGNPKPRLFRLPEAQALVNRLGFNSKGVDFLVEQVKRCQYKGVLGINIGKNFQTSIEKAQDDYLYCMQRVYPLASYIVVNISSPNTPGLRELQFGEYLNSLLALLKAEQKKLAQQYDKYVPLAIKVSPDLNNEEVKEIAESFLQHKIDAVIATNTTLSREGVEGLKYAEESGGLSGKPLLNKSTGVVQQLNTYLQKQIPIIAVGGISSKEDAITKFNAGADLVQIYTGFIFQGPELIRRIIKLLK